MADWISTFPLTQHITEFTKNQICRVISAGPVPKHVGFIMDGNRRYAKQNHMEMKEGHSAGFESMAKVLETCYDCGVEVATVFAFSIENFNRSRYEVEWLMELGKAKFKQVVGNGELCERYGIKIRVLGNLDLLPKDLWKVLKDAEELTKNNTRAILNVCWPYTSRDDMTHAVRKVVTKGYPPDAITEHLVAENLYTGGLPKLDLLIRTSAVYRLSDFMLWECIDLDCDIEIVSVLWPEFSPARMAWILLKWGFGRTYYGHRMAKLINIDDHTKQT
ncbi:hypothetical protein FOA43_001380 [Brettanomyces nanus]|uniref:Alkyl transferase n=1 Tax=Eeniella nana TaxID=13502 RepID=A0A875S2K6_EENNA|nr:uncharacterized protein FOA43_001380 [Brettanomyces nanus]QPG74059.1 hypothetical protein FOA43_001380 [Brettanomyces nanus]